MAKQNVNSMGPLFNNIVDNIGDYFLTTSHFVRIIAEFIMQIKPSDII